MSESITITFSGDDKKTFEQFTGINFAEGMTFNGQLEVQRAVGLGSVLERKACNRT